MKLKAVLVALAVAALAAAGAPAEGPPPPSGTTGPGGPGAGRPGHPGGPTPGRSHDQGQAPDQGQGGSDQGEPGQGNQGPTGRAADRTFRQQLSAAGYRCLPRPVMLMGSLTSVGTDSITVHPLRLRNDVTVKVLAATQFVRLGKPAKIADLVVKDRVVVIAAACRAATSTPTTTGQTGTAGPTGPTGAPRTPPTLVARRVGARPAPSTTTG